MNLLKNRKRLNNKGFTLIELLAVVVILAVVMGIAMTSVLSSMNNSRKGSLENSAKSVSQAFQTKYSESMVIGTTNDVYSDADGVGTGMGYNFNKGDSSDPVFYTLTPALSNELNLSASTYVLSASDTGTPKELVEDATAKTLTTAESFVAFNGSRIVVCLVAENEGSYYVANFAHASRTASIFGVTVTFSNANSDKLMWSCSAEGENSWTV